MGASKSSAKISYSPEGAPPDIGTNTTRLLVADVTEGQVTEVERRTTITTLDEGLDATGRLATVWVTQALADECGGT